MLVALLLVGCPDDPLEPAPTPDVPQDTEPAPDPSAPDTGLHDIPLPDPDLEPDAPTPQDGAEIAEPDTSPLDEIAGDGVDPADSEDARVEPPPGPTLAEAALYFAPVWYQDTANGGPDGEGARADLPTRVDYDGDLVHNNNWDNLPGAALRARPALGLHDRL